MRLPVVDPHEMIKVLEARGFRKTTQSGSHVQFKDDRGTVITIPLHPGRDIGKGLLRKILRDLEISREEFIKALGKA